MSATLVTFLFETSNFVVLALALTWLVFKPVRAMLASQRAKQDAQAAEAEHKLAEAERTRAEIAAAHQRLQEELAQVRSRELESARRDAEQITLEARAAVQRERDVLRREAAQLSEDEAGKLAQAAAAAAAATVAELLEQVGGPNLQSALIRMACEQLRSLRSQTLAPVKIESAAPLAPADRTAIQATLGESARQATFLVDESIGAGIRISTGGGLIDGTAGGLAEFARQALIKQLSQTPNNHYFQPRANDARSFSKT
jgi:F-type H+-transporting ATPase subunit b